MKRLFGVGAAVATLLAGLAGGVAAAPAPDLKPALQIGPASPVHWTIIGSDAGGTYAYGDIAPGPAVTLFVQRTQGRPGPDGTILTAYNLVVVDCARQDFVVLATDTYDAGNRLVSTVSRDFPQAEVVVIHPGSIMSAATGPACGTPYDPTADKAAAGPAGPRVER